MAKNGRIITDEERGQKSPIIPFSKFLKTAQERVKQEEKKEANKEGKAS